MLRLAVPLMVAEMGWMLMNFVDLAMIGRVGPQAIASVSIGSAVFYVFAIVAEGILLGLDSIVSQQYGAGEMEDCHRSLFAALQLAVPLGMALVGVIWVSVPLLPHFGIETQVAPQVGPFLHAMSWGLPPLLAYFAVRRYLQAIHLVNIIPFTLISANLINFAGNWVLIYGHMGFPAMGAEGSGWSTTISRFYMVAVLAGYVMWQNRKRGFHLGRYAWELYTGRIWEIVKLGAPAAGQIAMEMGVFSASTLIAGRLGAVAVSGHQIALSLASFTFMVPLGVSSATAVRVGHALGRGDAETANASGWTGVAVSATFMSCAALAFWLIPRPLVAIFTTDPAVMKVAVSLLAIAAIFQFFDGVHVTSIGALRGSGDTHTAVITDFVGWWIVGLPLGWYLCFEQGMGVRGLWAGLCVGLIAIGIALATAWKLRMDRLKDHHRGHRGTQGNN